MHAFGLPWFSDGKESACNAGDPGLIPGSGRSPGERNGYPLQYSCLRRSHGQRRLAGYSPWGHKESKQLTLSFHFHAYIHLPFGIYRVSFMHQALDDICEEHWWTWEVPSSDELAVHRGGQMDKHAIMMPHERSINQEGTAGCTPHQGCPGTPGTKMCKKEL